MNATNRIETALSLSLHRMTREPCPPLLRRALEHAVFPGGGRVRPRLVLAVAEAIDGPATADQPLIAAGAAAIELLHCASLVHDDLPCFDDAEFRRGRPTVHAAYGESTAVLVGDALIVGAFQQLTGSAAAAQAPQTAQAALRMLEVLGEAAGSPFGIAAGQAWEAESAVDLVAYHHAKTASMFEASVALGALAVGAEPSAWRSVGRLLGEAYQLADDLADLSASAEAMGKPVGQDRRNGRPNAALHLGINGARLRLRRCLEAACEAVPLCPGRSRLQGLVQQVGLRLSSAAEATPTEMTPAVARPAAVA